jgi:hypothetical protein
MRGVQPFVLIGSTRRRAEDVRPPAVTPAAGRRGQTSPLSLIEGLHGVVAIVLL